MVVGNPPWNEITVEELAFYALREPGLRGWSNLADRRRRIAELNVENPGWRGELEAQQEQMATLRQFFWQSGEYHLWSMGDTDLYQLFCERYSHLGQARRMPLGVVLPRTAFLAQGAIGFRQWLFTQTIAFGRIDLLLNNRTLGIHDSTPIHHSAADWTTKHSNRRPTFLGHRVRQRTYQNFEVRSRRRD